MQRGRTPPRVRDSLAHKHTRTRTHTQSSICVINKKIPWRKKKCYTWTRDRRSASCLLTNILVETLSFSDICARGKANAYILKCSHFMGRLRIMAASNEPHFLFSSICSPISLSRLSSPSTLNSSFGRSTRVPSPLCYVSPPHQTKET